MVRSLWRRRGWRSWLADLQEMRLTTTNDSVTLPYTSVIARVRVCFTISFSLTPVQYQLSMGSKQLVVPIIERMVFAGVFRFFFSSEAVSLRNLTSLSTSWDVICNEETIFGICREAWRLTSTYLYFRNLQSHRRRRWRIYRQPTTNKLQYQIQTNNTRFDPLANMVWNLCSNGYASETKNRCKASTNENNIEWMAGYTYQMWNLLFGVQSIKVTLSMRKTRSFCKRHIFFVTSHVGPENRVIDTELCEKSFFFYKGRTPLLITNDAPPHEICNDKCKTVILIFSLSQVNIDSIDSAEVQRFFFFAHWLRRCEWLHHTVIHTQTWPSGRFTAINAVIFLFFLYLSGFMNRIHNRRRHLWCISLGIVHEAVKFFFRWIYYTLPMQ